MKHNKVEDEIKFKELLNNPIRLFGWLYPYFFGVILIIGIFYVKNLTEISFNKIPSSYIDSLNVDRDISQKKGGLKPAVDLDLVQNPTDEMLTKGKDLYDANCQSCHGAEGRGDGPAGVALNPPPRNFHVKEGWTNGRSIIDLYKTLEEGIIQNGMAAYEYLPPEDRLAMIHYVRSFDQYPEITDEQVKELDASYKLSAGTMIPNQIPVKKSINILKREFESKFNSEPVLSYLSSADNSPGAQVLRDYSYDSEFVLKYTLRSNLPVTLDEYIRAVSLAPQDLGYKTEIINLDRTEWQELYRLLRGFVNSSKS